jgi:hypothetical protein
MWKQVSGLEISRLFPVKIIMHINIRPIIEARVFEVAVFSAG